MVTSRQEYLWRVISNQILTTLQIILAKRLSIDASTSPVRQLLGSQWPSESLAHVMVTYDVCQTSGSVFVAITMQMWNRKILM
jgi:hypothetical protein